MAPAPAAPAGPTGPEAADRLPPHWLRLLAYVVDIGAVGIPIGVAAFLGRLSGVGGLWLWLIVLAASFTYYVAVSVWLTGGRTIGKAMCGLTVRRIDGSPPPRTPTGLGWAIGRHTLGYLVVDVFGLGTLAALFTPRRRCLHDYAFASEVVVAREPAGSPLTAGGRLKAYAERVERSLDEIDRRYHWLLFLWKWVTRLVLAVVSWLVALSGLPHLIDAAAAKAPAAHAVPAEVLPVKATVALWAATTVVTTVIVTVVDPLPDPIASIRVVIDRGTVGEAETYEIYSMRADGTQQVRLTSNHFEDVQPDLFGDRRVVFTSSRDGDDEIYVMNADGSGQVRLTDDDAADWCPDWSPDGTMLAFTSSRDGNDEIYVMNADGSEPRRLTPHPAGDGSPVWSPDGTKLAFTSDRDGNQEIYLVNADGSDPRRLTRHGAVDRSPQFSPEGTKILFFSGRGLQGEANESYAMSLDGTDLIRITSFNECDPEETATCSPSPSP